MKKIFQPERVAAAVSQSKYREMLEGLPVKLFLAEYDAGEFVSTPERRSRLFQIVVEGALSIYYIRDDGSTYSLAASQADDALGESELFRVENLGVYAEVTEKLTCIAFSIDENREALLHNAAFLRVVAESLAGKMAAITMKDAAQPSLPERVCAFMRYKCKNGAFKGVEAAAFHLHCSPRQLQRVLNELERGGTVRKIGKGSYELCSL